MTSATYKNLLIALGIFALGGALGAAAMLGILYNKPGKNMIWKLGRITETRDPGSPQLAAQGARAWQPAPGMRVEVAAAGLNFPTRIVFHPAPPKAPTDPFFFVAELGGAIKLVTRDGHLHTVAENLLNFKRGALDELGLIGLAFDEAENHLFIALTYWDEEDAVFRNKVERLVFHPDTLSTSERTVLLDMKGEETVASYQIQFCALGPEGLLYVGVGSGGRKIDAQNLDRFAGKILRMNQDGTPVESNPFYTADHAAPRAYVYAYGMRNPYDIAWDPRSYTPVVSDVGPGIDRILRLHPGVNYVFGDDDNQMRANALYTWGPGSGFAPTGVAFAAGDALGVEHAHRLFVGLFGAVHLPGPNEGKRIARFDIGPDGWLQSAAADFVTYTGTRFASVTDVEWGPDGLYFADIYGESTEPHFGGGVIYRVVRDPDWTPPEDPLKSLSGVARGRYLFFDTRCNACHVIEGAGGREGPSLANARETLSKRLLAPDYDRWLDELSAKEGRYFERNREKYQTLRDLHGAQRLRRWLRYHIHDPRFDNPKAKMPSHDLSDEDVDAIAAFLLK